MLKQSTQESANRDGAMLPMLAFTIIILFVAVALGVDIARMHLTRAELRTATDASARAGVEALGRTEDRQLSIDAAINIASLNKVAGKSLTIDEDDIEVGTATQNANGSFTFSDGGAMLTSVRVNASRDENSADGPVGLMFAPIFGVTEFKPTQTSAATRSERDIALVLDVSGSMQGAKFTSLGVALNSFLDVLDASPQEERVSLTVYESESRKLQGITSDLQLIRDAFAEEAAGGGTAIGLGLQTGLDSVLNDPGSRNFAINSIVLMTDGMHNVGIDPEGVATNCAAAGVSVITVTFGAGADETRMQGIANQTSGRHLHAESGADLESAFQEIARQLSVVLIE